MKNLLKKITIIVSVFLCLWGGFFVYNRLTDGFSIAQMSMNYPYPGGFSTPLTAEQKNHLLILLRQPFRYLGKGCQFYAFESADKQYIVKFLKQKHLRPPMHLERLPVPAFLKQKIKIKRENREKRVKDLFSSSKLALEEMPGETGLLYLHFDRSPIEVPFVIIDHLGIKHCINLGDFDFVVQQRAETIKQVFESLLQKKELGELPKKLDQLVSLVRTRCHKGIRDRDRSFAQNVGFAPGGEKAVFIDIGQFFKDHSIQAELETEKELKRRLGNLKAWTLERYPELVPYMDEAFEQPMYTHSNS